MEKSNSFIFSPGQKAPEVSDYFGQGTNELSKASTWATVGVIDDEGEGDIKGGIELRVGGEDLGADVNWLKSLVQAPHSQGLGSGALVKAM